MGKQVEAYQEYRSKMNKALLASDNKVIKKIYNLDASTYQDGALNAKTKEMMGLVASMVLRCDDCVKYHLLKCHELGMNTEELHEIFAVANVVGGTIVIPYTRRALEFWNDIEIPA